MYDDDHLPEPFYTDDYGDDEPTKSLSARNCLFLSISLLLIASLIGSSIVAYFVVTRQESRSGTVTRSQDAPSAPTAAPATVVAAVPTHLPTPAPEIPGLIPEIDRIAIVNNDGQIETMAPDGGDRRVLTLESDNVSFQFPAWAPDGRRLAVVGSRTLGGGIYVLEDTARTGLLGERQIYFSPDETPFYLFWSPDSSNLAFLANHSRDLMGLNVVAGDGTDDSRLLATGAPFYWDWSDDGRQLLVHSGQTRADNSLALIGLDGETQTDNLAIPGYFQAPGIGQGGRYWAFAEEAGDGLSALVVVDTQTGERKIHEQAGSLALSWSPAKDQIAFTNGAVNAHPYWGPLHLLDITTGETRFLSTQTVLAFFWSPDGRSIAFITLGRDEGDESINAFAPDKARRVGRIGETPVQQQGRGFLTLSVVDVETGNGLRLLDFEPTAAYISQFLPFFDQYSLSHRIWSPDSTKLVLPVREETGNAIMVVSAHGGRPHRLADGDIAEIDAQ